MTIPTREELKSRNRRALLIALGIVVGLALLLVAMGSLIGTQEPAVAPSATPVVQTPTPTPSTGVIKNDAYASVENLKLAAVASGYPGPKWTEDPKPGPKYAKESGSCSDEDVFSVYADSEAVAKQRAEGEGLINMLIGPNWIVNVP